MMTIFSYVIIIEDIMYHVSYIMIRVFQLFLYTVKN